MTRLTVETPLSGLLRRLVGSPDDSFVRLDRSRNPIRAAVAHFVTAPLGLD